MSVKQVQDRINTLLQENKLGTRQFTALLFAFVSSFDLDGLSRTLLTRWYVNFLNQYTFSNLLCNYKNINFQWPL